MSKKLEMTFLTDTGKNVTLRISDPKEGLTKSQVLGVMDTIISKNVFVYSGGDLVGKVRTRFNILEELP